MKHSFYFLFLMVIAIYSCSDDDDSPLLNQPIEVIDEDSYLDGYFVTNEGPFNNGFGTVDYLNSNLTERESSIYQFVNEDDLGNIVQSMALGDSLAYIVTNVSSRLTVVNKGTFEERARITSGLNNPRNMLLVNSKGFVTNWGDPNDPSDDFVAVVDLETNAVVNTIPVSEGPEDLITIGNTLYVAHQGGFGVNNLISVISIANEVMITTIEVGDVPNSMSLDSSGRLVVLCGGAPAFSGTETPGQLDIIETNSYQVVESYPFSLEEHPNYLNISGDDVYYYLDGAVYKTTIENVASTTQPLITGVNFFNMVILADRTIAGCDAADFASNGSIELYDAITGDFINSLGAGVIPGNIYSIE